MTYVPARHTPGPTRPRLDEEVEAYKRRLAVCQSCPFHVKPPRPGATPGCRLLYIGDTPHCGSKLLSLLYGHKKHPKTECKWHAAGL